MNNQRTLNNKKNNSETGQSLVELALIIVFLLFLVAGLLDLGRMIFTYLAMRDAAQEGAVYGSIEPTGDINKRVQDNLPAYESFSTTVTFEDLHSSIPNICSGDKVSVTVSTLFGVRMPLIGIFTGGTLPLSATIKDTVLAPPCS